MDSTFTQLENLHALRSVCAKPLIGLVGGIGSGKSTVAECFAKLGCGVIDADAINRELLTDRNVQAEIIAACGEAVVSAGKLDTARLADYAFANAPRLRRLTDLLHPRILRRMVDLAKRLNADEKIAAVVLDVPLLAEVGIHGVCDAVVFVHVDLPERIRRLKASRGWDADAISNREKFQFPLDMKRKMSDHTVDNSHSLQTCAQQIGRVFTDILTRCHRKGSERTA